VIGFTKDDTYLGYQVSRCDPCPAEFEFESSTKPRIHLGYRTSNQFNPLIESESAFEVRLKAHNDGVDAKLAALGVERNSDAYTLRGPFPFPDLAFAYRVSLDTVKGTEIVSMGLRVKGEDPVLPVRLVLGPNIAFNSSSSKDALQLSTDIDAIYANVTKDGSDIGFVANVHGVMWTDFAAMARRKTADLVSQTYNETGLRYHTAGKYEKGVYYFEKAVAVAPKSALVHYNLACGYARAGDSRAEANLKRAILLGGAQTKARAKKDEDFTSVRESPWFRAL
jgi:tetratricopeptide (TPR) repeat protein